MKSGKSHRKFWIASAIIAVIFIAAAAAGPIMSQVEQPEYKVEATAGPFEIRNYAPLIVAETTVQGERSTAIREGFRRIAAYIFGSNAPKAKIDMTAPVQQQKQTIAMTAPVTQQDKGGSWAVRFVMPKNWTLETLPTPLDQRVSIKQVPARRFAVITFSGFGSSSAVEAKTSQLKKFIADRKLETTGEPLLAFYNPPWTLPFFRRNEIMLELLPSA
jgi:effector-binding domain-containing protein